MTAAAHMLAAWDFEPTREEGCAFAIYPAATSEPLAYVAARDGSEEIARLMTASPKLRNALRELMDFCKPVAVIRKQDGSEIVHPAFEQAREALAATVDAVGEGYAYV